jgi:hypothetical protein
MATNTISRTLHDTGLALWSGGSAMGAIGVNGATKAAEPRERIKVAGAGWKRWQPAHVGAVAAYGLGSAGLILANRRRMRWQDGVGRLSMAKTALTMAALGADAYATYLGRKAGQRANVPVDSATSPTDETPADVAKTLKQLRVAQWVVPALTGALVVLSAQMGEQQRPREVARGMAKRLLRR